MNLFTRNSPYYHLLKYLLFFLKHPVYTIYCIPAFGPPYMNLFTQKSAYYHLLKYLLFFLKHPIYTIYCIPTFGPPCMNLFTRKSAYYHLLKYLLFSWNTLYIYYILYTYFWPTLYEFIYSEQSLLPPPKIFTIPPETPCTAVRSYVWML
jgi:hypothetical protein